MDIQGLLNDQPPSRPLRQCTLDNRQTSFEEESSPKKSSSETSAASNSLEDSPRGKKIVDAATFERGPPIGAMNFVPHEVVDQSTKQKLDKFQIYPSTGIAQYPRHIPYSSIRRDFQQMTGRDRFEVFQYTFRYGQNNKEWVVMWDYNIGIVRITPFFKSLGHGKTVPKKAIATTPGLRDIAWSITGGSLAAQGYWMPFEAAKALAATFCWKIRYALIPLFGQDFPQMCTPVESIHDVNFQIPQAVVESCQDEVTSWTSNGSELRFDEDEDGDDKGFQNNQQTDTGDNEDNEMEAEATSSPEPGSSPPSHDGSWPTTHDEELYMARLNKGYNSSVATSHSYPAWPEVVERNWTPFHQGQDLAHGKMDSASTNEKHSSWPTPPNDDFLKMSTSYSRTYSQPTQWIPGVYTEKEMTVAEALTSINKGERRNLIP